jgi:hypothetical protein
MSGTPDDSRNSTQGNIPSRIVGRMSPMVSPQLPVRSRADPGLFMNEKRGSSPSKPRTRGAVPAAGKTSSASSATEARLALPERISKILATRKLTLYDVSRRTFGGERRYRIPRNFYFRLRSSGLSPTIYQLSALAKLSAYRLADWLEVFGFRLDEIVSAGLHLPRWRTTLVDTSIHDLSREIPWFRNRPRATSVPPVAPLSLLLEAAGPQRLSSLLSSNEDGFVYARIGCEDSLAYPDLVPCSIIRANPRHFDRLLPKSDGQVTETLFLVEHARGLCCCRLHQSAKNRITLAPTQLAFAQVEFELGSEARILGAVDLEFRPLRNKKQSGRFFCSLPEVAPELAKLWKPSALRSPVAAQRPSSLLRNARLRAGLSFREASELSHEVVHALGDQRYFMSPGSLSDCEASDKPPRDIHKLFTLCILYSIGFAELMNSFGFPLTGSDSDPMPAMWTGREEQKVSAIRRTAVAAKAPQKQFLEDLAERFVEIPFFLRSAIPTLSGLSQISLHDVFWTGGQTQPLHPALGGALFLIVNRLRKTPVAFRRKSMWGQPLYLLRKRDGSYLSTSCSLEDGMIVVHPYTEGFVRPERLRNRVDAEVVGQIVTVIRSLPSPH